jgi:predicted secreted Zn-dependent protease
VRIAAAIALVVGAASTARAEVLESFEETAYTAYPKRGQSLRQALDEATSIRQDGKIFHGHTRWNVHWAFRWWQEANGRCRITSNTTRLDLVVTLPQLGSGSGEQRTRFQRFREALRAHELGHARIARQAARDIDRAILDLPEMASCTSLEAAANRVAKALLAESEREQRRYDRVTEHGRRDGASLD